MAAADAGLPVPAESVQKAREIVTVQEDSFRLAARSRVRISMGTDAGHPHGSNLKEIVRMNELAMSPVATVRNATTEAADLLGLGAIGGAIEPAEAADVVIVDDDPLVDLSGLPGRVRDVWSGGRLVG